MKLKIGLIFGGSSPEHKVSVQSAKSIYQSINKLKYEVLLIGISKSKKFILLKDHEFESLLSVDGIYGTKISVSKLRSLIDVAFPLVHGPSGEDGTLQGMLETFSIPYVGSGVLGSAICMNKEVTKRLLTEAGFKVAKYFVFTKKEIKDFTYNYIVKSLGIPFFIKPIGQGSYLGVSNVTSHEEYLDSIDRAFKYDEKILLEEMIYGKELECAVIGIEEPKTSIIGEIKTNDYYSYEEKYLTDPEDLLEIPANISNRVSESIQDYSTKIFNLLYCQGLARVDIFLTEEDEIIINEINTIPGFTNNSMFPKLWEKSGLVYKELIEKLIGYACNVHNEKLVNRTKAMNRM